MKPTLEIHSAMMRNLMQFAYKNVETGVVLYTLHATMNEIREANNNLSLRSYTSYRYVPIDNQ